MLGPEAVEALPSLRAVARDSPDTAVRSAADRAIKSISCVDDLNSQDPAVRITAALTLGRLGWRATPAMPDLIATMKDRDTNVRVAAANALGALGHVSDPAVVPSYPRWHARPTPPFGRRSWPRWKRLHREPPPCAMLT
jgi:uncharacterized protein (UPF0147 family)